MPIEKHFPYFNSQTSKFYLKVLHIIEGVQILGAKFPDY